MAPRDARSRLERSLAPLHADVLRFAAVGGLFDRLARGSARSEDLRRALRLSRRGAQGLFGVLVADGLVSASSNRLGLTAKGRSMPDLPQGPLATPWLASALRREGPVFPERSGAWERGRDLPDAADSTARMDALSADVAAALARRWPVPRVRSLLDVGGGSGVLSSAVARRFPSLRVTLADLPGVCEAARIHVARRRLSRRVDFVALDMFRDRWPTGHDAILLGNILHDWDDARCRRLAKKAFVALPRGGSVVLHEMLIDEDGGPLAVALFSLTMFAATRGRQRTGAELGAILRGAGFRDVRTVPAGGYFSVIWARKPA